MTAPSSTMGLITCCAGHVHRSLHRVELLPAPHPLLLKQSVGVFTGPYRFALFWAPRADVGELQIKESPCAS